MSNKHIKRFVADKRPRYSEFMLGLSAGYIDEEGCICNAQMGALETFSVGMPVYDVNNTEIGKLSIGLFKSLNYGQEHFDGDIPVEYWRVDGYKGERQDVKTYWQVIKSKPKELLQK